MSHSYASRHRAGGLSLTTLLAAKVACASAAVVAAAFFAVPHLVAAADAVVPRLWAVARFWLAPPYLFVTVHLIILVIWKLSDHKHFQAHHHKDPWPVVAHQHAAHPPPAVPVHDAVEDVIKSKKAAEFGAALYGGHMPEHDSEFSPDSGGGDSCVTTEESDEDASSYYSSSVETRRSVVAPAVQQERVLERDLSLPPSQTTVDGGDDDMDATWNAIMQKTRSAPAAPAPASPPPAQAQQQSPPPPRARDPSVGAEEMNRRFDDFIKKNRNSFGRH